MNREWRKTPAHLSASPGEVRGDRLSVLLAAWRDECRAEPATELLSVDRVVEEIQRAKAGA